MSKYADRTIPLCLNCTQPECTNCFGEGKNKTSKKDRINAELDILESLFASGMNDDEIQTEMGWKKGTFFRRKKRLAERREKYAG